jgi:hypothetical protein
MSLKTDITMEESIYTLGVWRVKPDQEAAFIEAWKALGKTFSELSHQTE